MNTIVTATVDYDHLKLIAELSLDDTGFGPRQRKEITAGLQHLIWTIYNIPEDEIKMTFFDGDPSYNDPS